MKTDGQNTASQRENITKIATVKALGRWVFANLKGQRLYLLKVVWDVISSCTLTMNRFLETINWN
jgi:hypothetical protein